MTAYNSSGALRVEPVYEDALAITPSDTAPNAFTDVYVGVTGDVSVITKAAQARAILAGTAPVASVFKAVPAGTKLGVSVALVNATSTTATFMLGCR